MIMPWVPGSPCCSTRRHRRGGRGRRQRSGIRHVALDVDRATAEQLDTAAKALRADIAEVEKLKAAERAVKKLMDSLKPKPRAPREKIEKALKALFTAAETGALDSQEFFGALGVGYTF